MKQLFFSLALLLMIAKVYALSDSPLNEINSFETHKSLPDSIGVFLVVLDSGNSNYGPYVTKDQRLQGEDQEIKLQLANRALLKGNFWKKIGGFFKGVFNFLTFQPKFGYFEVEGQTNQGPFTLFDRTDGAPSLQQQVADIQEWILTDPEAGDIYRDIWVKATTGSIDNGGCDGTGTCEAASTAKCASFIYIIGLKVNSTTGAITHMGNPSINDPGQTERDVFYEIAMGILENLQNPYPGAFFADDGFVGTTLNIVSLGVINQLIASTVNLAQWDDMQYRAKEQEMFLQTFDLLKWSQKIVPTLESPNPTRIDGVVKDLKDKIVVPMHRRVKFGQYFANNNVTLMPAAAMGMASVVLHDDGAMLLSYNKHPKKWAHAANYNIHNTMWHAWLGSPMSKAGDKYGYAEGTHYFQQSFESLLPYFKTYANYVPRNYSQRYFSGVVAKSGQTDPLLSEQTDPTLFGAK